MPHPDDYDYDRGDDRRDDRYDDRRRDDRDDDRRRDDDYDDYEERPRRGGRKRALEKVSLPAIFLMILGGLGLAFAIFRTVTDLMMGDEAMDNNPFMKNDPGMKDFQKTMMIIGPILNVIWAVIVFFGGLCLKRLQGRGYVMFACVWAMLPCSLCCLLGLPFGIWGLVVANDEVVKRGFNATARSESYG
jgi:hypothetical protein